MSQFPSRVRAGGRSLAALLVLTGLTAVLLAAVAALGYASSGSSAAQLQYTPVNTAPPSVTGAATTGSELVASPGTWTGDAPIAYAYRWQRCNAVGTTCVDIAGATGQRYTLATADLGSTVRVAVTATNAGGSSTATSPVTAVVVAPGPAGQQRLDDGRISIPVTSVSPPERLIVSRVAFTPNPVRSRRETIVGRFVITDTRGYVVRDALVFARATPLVTSTPPELRSQPDGSVRMRFKPRPDFPLGKAVQFFVRARKDGDNPLAGVSTARLVQVRTVPG